MPKNWIYSWALSFSKIHRPFSHSEKFAKITDILTVGPLVRNHNSAKMAETDKMKHGELRTHRCPCFIDRLFKLSYTYISNIIIAGISKSNIASSTNSKWERVREAQYG